MADENKIDYIAHRLDTVADKVGVISETLSTHVAKFELHVNHIAEQKQDIKRNVDILQNNTLSLQDHMKRTEILEDYVKKIDERFTPLELELMRKKAVGDWIKARVFFLAKLGAALGAMGTIFAVLKFVLQVF